MAHPERFALHFDATYRLLSLSLKPSTRARYQGGVDCFRQFLCHYLSLPALPRSFRSSAVRLDRLFATFTMFAFEDDLPFSSVKAAFWGLKKLNPQLGKFGLPVSFSLVCKSWQRLRPSKSALPISWPLTCLLAATLLESGHTRAAVLALLSFDCYLRVNEGCTLLKGGCRLGGGPSLAAASKHQDRRIARPVCCGAAPGRLSSFTPSLVCH